MLLSSCAAKSKCNIKEEHVYLFFDEKSSLKRYEKFERLALGDYNWTDNSRFMTNASVIVFWIPIHLPDMPHLQLMLNLVIGCILIK